jgi:hypothetical protein
MFVTYHDVLSKVQSSMFRLKNLSESIRLRHGLA